MKTESKMANENNTHTLDMSVNGGRIISSCDRSSTTDKPPYENETKLLQQLPGVMDAFMQQMAANAAKIAAEAAANLQTARSTRYQSIANLQTTESTNNHASEVAEAENELSELPELKAWPYYSAIGRELWEKLIRKNLVKSVRTVDFDILVPALQQYKVVPTRCQMESLQARETRSARVSALNSYLQRRTPKDVYRYLICLRETGQYDMYSTYVTMLNDIYTRCSQNKPQLWEEEELREKQVSHYRAMAENVYSENKTLNQLNSEEVRRNGLLQRELDQVKHKQKHQEDLEKTRKEAALQQLRRTTDEPSSDEQNQCSVCLENKKRVICVPCYHFILCCECALTLYEGVNSYEVKPRCPTCRTLVDSFTVVFA
jgi:hypothetical protein